MPIYRKLYVKAVESLDIQEMPDDTTRLMWLLLPLVLCQNGCGVYSGPWLKAKLFPLRDDLSSKRVWQKFQWFVERGMVMPYEVGERSYFHVPSFLRYQGRGTRKETKSNYPLPLDLVLPDWVATPELLRSNSGASPELVPTNSAPHTYTDADAYTDAKAETTSPSTEPNQRPSSATADGDVPNSKAKVAENLENLEAIGVHAVVAATLAGSMPHADVQGWTQYAESASGLNNPAGFVVKMLQERAPPPEPEADDDWRRFISGDYADYVEG